jgi:hypothetical protein
MVATTARHVVCPARSTLGSDQLRHPTLVVIHPELPCPARCIPPHCGLTEISTSTAPRQRRRLNGRHKCLARLQKVPEGQLQPMQSVLGSDLLVRNCYSRRCKSCLRRLGWHSTPSTPLLWPYQPHIVPKTMQTCLPRHSSQAHGLGSALPPEISPCDTRWAAGSPPQKAFDSTGTASSQPPQPTSTDAKQTLPTSTYILFRRKPVTAPKTPFEVSMTILQ